MIEYKGYFGRIEFDEDANIFHGEIVNTRDVITFQGKSVSELRKAMRDSVDTYLQFCEKRGKKPDKFFIDKKHGECEEFFAGIKHSSISILFSRNEANER